MRLGTMRQLVTTARNLAAYQQAPTDAQTAQLVDALEQAVRRLERLHRRRKLHHWRRHIRLDAGPR